MPSCKMFSRFLTAVVLAVGIAGTAQAQCTGGLIIKCPAAVSPQPTDVLQLWQINQTPHMRSIPLSQILTSGQPFSTLAVTGNASIGGTLSLGPSTGLVSVHSNSTGGWAFQLGGASSLMFFNNSSGSAMLQLDSGNKIVQPKTTLNIDPPGVWSGGLFNGNSALVEQFNYTGTSTSTSGYTAFNFIQLNDAVTNTGGSGTAALWLVYNINSTAKTGFGVAEAVSFGFSAPSGNLNGGQYVGIGSTVAVSSGDNGTLGNPKSSWTALNPVLTLSSAALYTGGGSAQEADIGFAVAATTKIGLLIDLLPQDTTQATIDDIALAIDKGSTSPPGFLNGLSFGRFQGNFPIATTGTLINGLGLAGAGFTVANGVDWHLGTFTGNSWNDGHFKLTGAGELIGSKITDPNTAPGAGAFKLTMEAGTTSGTCKLVARAGTSATPVTVIDNVGGGC